VTPGAGARWRLLRHAPDDGAWNMGVDEALLLRYAAAPGPLAPTLRLYGWRPAAISLGHAQRLGSGALDVDLRSLGRLGIDLVRRPTGGRAVLHDRELTYAVVGRSSGAFAGSVLDTYKRIALALVAGLRSLGVSAELAPRRPARREPAGVSCFSTPAPHEIVVGGRKLVGSAQARRRGAFLQHGSIPLDASSGGRGDTALAAIGGTAPGEEATTLAGCLGAAPPAETVATVLVAAFERSFDARLEPGELTADEAALAERLRCWRYDSARWTLRGRSGEREARWGPSLDWNESA
jgi:lipoate-protein ligase A